jgi:hypothetical protein
MLECTRSKGVEAEESMNDGCRFLMFQSDQKGDGRIWAGYLI